MGKKLSFDTFQERCIKKFNNKVDLSLIDESTFCYTHIQKFKCNIHNVIFEKTPKRLLRFKYICPECWKEQQKLNSNLNSKLRKKTYLYKDKFLQKLKERFNDNIIIKEKDIVYNKQNSTVNQSAKMKFICKFHGEFLSTPRNLFRSKYGCSKCAQKHTNKKLINKGICAQTSFKEQAEKVHGDRYDYSKTVYKSRNKKLLITCKQHGDFYQYPSLHLRGEGCPTCYKEHIYNTEQRIGYILKQQFPNESIKYQYRNKELFGRQSFDYYIENKNILIEYQGRQHFIDTKWYNDYRHSLQHTQELDKKKYDIAINNGYTVIYITLWNEFESDMFFTYVYTDIDSFVNYLKTLLYNRDNEIISKYIDLNNNSIKNNYQYWKNIDLEDKEYIENRFKHISNIKLSECLYMIYHNLENRPKCPVCNKDISLDKFSYGYKIFCSNECKYSDIGKQIILNKQKKTCLQKYGVDNPMKNEQIKNKAIENCKQTNIKKYGVEYNLQRDDVRQDIINTVKNKTGYKYAFNDKEKVLNTLHEKYGNNIDNVFQIEFVKNKSNRTKQLNNSFKISKYEEITYDILKEKYGNIIRQYKSKLYPYNCDFYIQEKDVYIEINACWTHGEHPFNEDDIKDVNLFNEWMNKTDYYKNAAYNWRYKDVEKRNLALKNNLNYFELFPTSINDLKNKLKNILIKIGNL